MSTKVKLVFLGQSGSNPAAKSATISLNFPSNAVPNVGEFISLDGKLKFLVLNKTFEFKAESLHEVVLTVKTESV